MVGLILRPPPQLNMNEDEGLPERWKMWKMQFQDFRTLAGLSSAEREFQMSMFRYAFGEQAVRCVNTFPNEADEYPEDWENVMKKLECYCLGFAKDLSERYNLNCRVQEPAESVDQFVQALRHMATTCGYCDHMHDNLIKDRLIIGMRNGSLTTRMLRDPRLTLK
ncbi:hypothetical protein P879_10425 [Paragonimus westermani]|uniref:Uncharacterized protein n=1 Tax=Paragonimus westermani TaxID=34504 RepID=A0A8T0DEN8_9TREM|nr:hypothetical protein P879_10425 [Paragonimus westermani]